MVLPFAAWETAVLGYQRGARFADAWGWMKRLAMRSATVEMMDAYDVRPRNPTLAARKFSGGNQQKLVLAREALAPAQPPQVLLVGQPAGGGHRCHRVHSRPPAGDARRRWRGAGGQQRARRAWPWPTACW